MPARYSIKDLERLSGIKAHTLRIWEQRYHLLAPERTATNIRWYNGKDLKKNSECQCSQQSRTEDFKNRQHERG
ncbi:MAG: hypothetical protein Fur0041_12470 [Bacteroidia bacterium]